MEGGKGDPGEFKAYNLQDLGAIGKQSTLELADFHVGHSCSNLHGDSVPVGWVQIYFDSE